MTLLTFIPSQEGYSLRRPANGGAVALKGGLGRIRRDVMRVNHIATVLWKLNKARYEQLMDFYITTLKNGSETFQIDLIADEPGLTRHDVMIVAGSFQLMSVSGETYRVTAQLEVKPLSYDTTADNDIMNAYEVTAVTEGWA